MTFQTMANAVPQTRASSAEYNKVVSNVNDLDTRTPRAGNGQLTAYKNSALTLTGGTEYKMVFNVSQYTCPEFTLSGLGTNTGDTLTVNTAGLIRIKATFRLGTGSQGVAGYGRVRIASSGASTTNRMRETQTSWNGVGSAVPSNNTFEADVTFRATAGSTWSVYLLSSNNLSLDNGDNVFNELSVTWLGA
jgi:hypothetical protein